MELAQINTLIVDDEIGALKSLKFMLEAYCPNMRVICATTLMSEAIQAANHMHPDVVFLDIEMPPSNGFDFLKQCPNHDFGVIFTTAYPQYAIMAINAIQPWSYLVKPFSVTQLLEAVKITQDKIALKRKSILQVAEKQGVIIHDSRKGTIVLKAGNILYCKAEGSFTEFYVLKNNSVEKIISSGHLGEFEAELPKNLFCRTHHSYLVNLAYVDRFERTGRNGLIYLSKGGVEVQVSVAKMDAFSNRLTAYYQQSGSMDTFVEKR